MESLAEKKASLRALLLEQIDGWVDELIDESPAELNPVDMPERIRVPDLFSLCGAVTALTEEFRLQTRGYRKLNDEIATLRDHLDRAVAEPVNSTELPDNSGRNSWSEGRHEAQGELIGHFVEVHDRLYQTVQQLRTRLTGYGFFRRISGEKAMLQTIVQGLELSLERFDSALASCGLRRFGNVGDRFDPAKMRAAILNESSGKPAGEVTCVVRSGYFRFEQVWRYAEVEVAK
ncbi:MAG TPA: nucleotide exchange factor GrpE [Candidatus Rifleibacterium sp.]|jgi:molecular chaperone GrpE (heat shock protein)|nr:nucleotide exchange factor GrpE [Candidatus Rifleibacterium sp.]